MSYSHQDWKPVVFKKTKPLNEQEASRRGLITAQKKDVSNKSSNGDNKLQRKVNETETDKLPRPTRNLAQQIQRARIDKSITQKNLDKMCNFKPHTVAGYENCTCVVKQNELNSLSKALGLTLRNK